jgi:hypothetical protein
MSKFGKKVKEKRKKFLKKEKGHSLKKYFA